jgi:hypothetical protein
VIHVVVIAGPTDTLASLSAIRGRAVVTAVHAALGRLEVLLVALEAHGAVVAVACVNRPATVAIGAGAAIDFALVATFAVRHAVGSRVDDLVRALATPARLARREVRAVARAADEAVGGCASPSALALATLHTPPNVHVSMISRAWPAAAKRGDVVPTKETYELLDEILGEPFPRRPSAMTS